MLSPEQARVVAAMRDGFTLEATGSDLDLSRHKSYWLHKGGRGADGTSETLNPRTVLAMLRKNVIRRTTLPGQVTVFELVE